ncbi:hypothetical protein MTCD1_02035 [Colwellia marinimaniae]|uniref:Uncharacterized protein n=1 Tax=Colwellia marinimaniae TaxID=1513592 RepID=A0ABQ0MVN0_9GAMM|nr:hypothetical protein MTCD1_02035 [Colwellia marinimaniae]
MKITTSFFNMPMHLAQDRHPRGILIGRAMDGTY